MSEGELCVCACGVDMCVCVDMRVHGVHGYECVCIRVNV